jgi:hypothetical protein
MAIQDFFDDVQKLYIAYYQRPADSSGLRFWAQRLEAAGGSLAGIIDAFATSPEATALYGTINANTIGNVIDSIYQALFGRAPDAAGKQFYIDGFTSGRFTAGSIVLDILNGARNADAVAIQNKLIVANRFTSVVDGRPLTDPDFGTGTGFNATYAGNPDAQAARAFLATVTSNPATVPSQAQVIQEIKTHIANPGDPILRTTSDQTFALTTGVDHITLTNNQNSVVGIVNFNNSVSTLNAGDVIIGTGVDGDELRVILDAVSYPGSATITDVDNITVQVGSPGAVTFNASGVTGAKQIIMKDAVGAQTISNIGSLSTAVGITNTTQSLTADWSSALLGGSNDAVTVLLDTATGGAAAPQNITVSNGVEVVNVKTSGSKSDINNITDNVAGGSLKTINVAADAALRIRSLDPDITTFDASASTADVNVGFNLPGGTGTNITAIGGKGDDRFTFAPGDFDDKDKVTGGNGTDRLDVTLNANLAAQNQISGIETISANAAGIGAFIFNLKGDTDIKNFIVRADNTPSTITLTNVEQVLQTVGYEGNGTNANQNFDNLNLLSFVPGTGIGSSDATTVVVNNKDANGVEVGLAPGNAFNLGTLTLPGVENVTIDVQANGNANLTLSDPALTSLRLKATHNLTFNAQLDSAKLMTVDATEVKGNLTINTKQSHESVTIALGNGDNDVTVGDGNSNDDITLVQLGNGDNIIRVPYDGAANANGFFVVTGFNAGAGGDVIDFNSNPNFTLAGAAAGPLGAGGPVRLVVVTGATMLGGSLDETTLVGNFKNWASGGGVNFDNNLANPGDNGTLIVVSGNDNNSYIFRVDNFGVNAGIQAPGGDAAEVIQLVGVLMGVQTANLAAANFT